ncbi:transposase [Shewanella xiamenensis]|uniref:transposase n=1 Tax=Shewanella xiamenensis TaxID=332186 RepID=UPI0035B93D21
MNPAIKQLIGNNITNRSSLIFWIDEKINAIWQAKVEQGRKGRRRLFSQRLSIATTLMIKLFSPCPCRRYMVFAISVGSGATFLLA